MERQREVAPLRFVMRERRPTLRWRGIHSVIVGGRGGGGVNEGVCVLFFRYVGIGTVDLVSTVPNRLGQIHRW